MLIGLKTHRYIALKKQKSVVYILSIIQKKMIIFAKQLSNLNIKNYVKNN